MFNFNEWFAEWVCRDCHSVVKTKSIVSGHFLIEIILWCMFIIPGLIYSIWRNGTRKKVCAECGCDKVVVAHSKAGERFLKC